MKRKLLLRIILLLILIFSGCSSEKSNENTNQSAKGKSKTEQKQSICESMEEDALNTEKAVRNYFSNPFNDTMPQLSDLKNLSPKSTVSIKGDLEQIKIFISSENGACDKGKEFLISIPKGEKDGWQL